MKVSPEDVKIYDDLFVGIAQDSKTALGFLTPVDGTAASKSRVATVMKWLDTKKSYEGRTISTRDLKNEPLLGFRIVDDVKRKYFGGGNVVWRVQDPRGFELEISSANLMSLLQDCSIRNGRIDEHCIWARVGAQNVLLPTNTGLYSEVVATKTKKTPATPKLDLVEGAFYKMKASKSGKTAKDATFQYLGKWWISEETQHFTVWEQSEGQNPGRFPQVIGEVHSVGQYHVCLAQWGHFGYRVKLYREFPGTEMHDDSLADLLSPSEIERIVQNWILTEDCLRANGTLVNHHGHVTSRVVHASRQKTDVRPHIRPLTQTELESVIDRAVERQFFSRYSSNNPAAFFMYSHMRLTLTVNDRIHTRHTNTGLLGETWLGKKDAAGMADAVKIIQNESYKLPRFAINYSDRNDGRDSIEWLRKMHASGQLGVIDYEVIN